MPLNHDASSPSPLASPAATPVGAPSRISRRQWLAKASLAGTATLLALAGGEAALRLAAPSRPLLRFDQNVKDLQNLHLHQFSQLVENDPDLFWRLTPNRTLPADAWPFHGLIANAQGLRDDRLFPLRKPPGAFRILFLGDSCTFGYGLTHDESFVRVTQELLRQRFPGRAIECINAGVPAYTLYQGLRFLQTRGLAFEPDLVVATFGWNEGYLWDGMSDLEHAAALAASTPPPMLRWSRACQIAWGAAHRLRGARPRAGKSSRLSPAEFAKLLGQIDQVTLDHRLGLALIVWPGTYNLGEESPPWWRAPYQTELAYHGQRMLVRAGAWRDLIDLVPIAQDLARSHPVEKLYLDDCHASALANAAFARVIAARLAPALERGAAAPATTATTRPGG